MRSKSILYYLAIGLLILGFFMEEAEGRRKILRGRKTITRRYYRGTAIPAWSIVLISGIAMLVLGGGLYVVLKKYIIDDSDNAEPHSYHPAMQNEV
ncbi:uncharacterized protein LOC117169638 [Belonocnema kinseyi]|uniref:uncharacterized protein LOC117169638 n=1 Tax=Belonocnema kinseyi TaxID=2817044 RepID=UPI00143D2A2B|nr:uncharacterized protein LOC117169638 [Belonocnema kinseyi]